MTGIDPLVGDGPLASAFIRRRRAERAERGPKPTADSTMLRVSDALKCARQVGFKAADIPKTNGLTDRSLRAFVAGDVWHESLQEIVEDEWDGEAELLASYKAEGLSLSGSADGGWYDMPDDADLDGRVLMEIKSMKEYAWYLHTIGKGAPYYKNQKQPPGPSPNHLAQAGIYATSPQIDADFVHMVYVNKNDGQVAEWIIGIDQPLVHLPKPFRGDTVRGLAAGERERMRWIKADVDSGWLPAREHPLEGSIEDPPPFKDEDKGDPWFCRFCQWNDVCRGLPAERVPLDAIPTQREDAA